MHTAKKIHKNMTNTRIARQALLQAYRSNKMSSGANIIKGATQRINNVVKNETRRSNIKNALLAAANKKTLMKKHNVPKNNANKIQSAAINKAFKEIMNQHIVM